MYRYSNVTCGVKFLVVFGDVSPFYAKQSVLKVCLRHQVAAVAKLQLLIVAMGK